jgi:phosphatidate cytidylyltransferase
VPPAVPSVVSSATSSDDLASTAVEAVPETGVAAAVPPDDASGRPSRPSRPGGSGRPGGPSLPVPGQEPEPEGLDPAGRAEEGGARPGQADDSENSKESEEGGKPSAGAAPTPPVVPEPGPTTSQHAGGGPGGPGGAEHAAETGTDTEGPLGGGPGEAGEVAADPPKKRSGRNLPIAVGVGAGLGALVLISLYSVKEIFLAVMVVFLVLGLRELSGAFETRDIRVPLIPLGVGLVAGPVAAYAWGPDALVASLALVVLTVLVWRMAVGPADGYVRDVTAAVFVTGYLILMGGIVALLMAPDDGHHRIVIFISVTVASDIGGFFAGTFFGRHKLAPAISPKKTWEGVTGSALACMLVGVWLMWWLLDDGAWWHGVLIGAAAVVTATVGDLIESMLKRDLGIKDMGSLLPEHGGVMDRLDSLLATAPVVWLLLELFTPSG